MSRQTARDDLQPLSASGSVPIADFDVSQFSSASPMSLVLPARKETLDELRKIFESGHVLIGDIVTQILADPAFTVELFARANQPLGKSPSPELTKVKSLVFRLGAQEILRTVELIAHRSEELTAATLVELDRIREYSARVAGVAEIIAFATFREHAEAARTVGMLSVVGQMLACIKFGDLYIELAQNLSRPALVYRMSHDFRFDLRTVMLAYLKSRNVPQSLHYIFDRDFVCKTPNQAALRFIIDSACELVENFEHNRFERYSPENELPGKSSLRLLRLNERQHEQIFLEVGKFLLETTPQPIEDPVVVDLLPTDLGEIEYIEVGEDDKHHNGPIPFSDAAKLFITRLDELIRSTRKAEDLLPKLLRLLVDEGPYRRAALLVLQQSKKLAVIHTVAGNFEAEGKSVSVKDPISPLALGAVKIRSFNSTEVVDFHAPFGVSAYALAPIQIRDVPPVVLYVDCGNERCLPFEGRKLFRLVVGLVNRVLSVPVKVVPVDLTEMPARF